MQKYLYVLTLLCITQIIFSQNNSIEITYERRSDNSVDFYYSKDLPGSYSLRLEFTIRPTNEKNGISFSYKLTYTLGDPNPNVKESIQYSLPFIKGKDINIKEASYLGETYFGNEKPKAAAPENCSTLL